MCLLDVTMVFLLHKQTFNTGAEQVGPITATVKLHCLSAYHITSPISLLYKYKLVKTIRQYDYYAHPHLYMHQYYHK